MKKYSNVRELILAFLNGEDDAFSGTSSFLSNTKIKGDTLFHYSTPILQRADDKFIINTTKYSIQTDRLQKQILSIVPQEKQILISGVELDYKGKLSDFYK